MKETRILFFMMGVMRWLGFIPYRFSYQSSAATFSSVLLVYSLGLNMAFEIVILNMQISTLPIFLSSVWGTQYIIFLLMNICLLTSVLLTPMFFLLCSQKVAKAFASLLQLHNKLFAQFIENKLDKYAIFQMLFTIFIAINAVIFTIQQKYSWYENTIIGFVMFYSVVMRFVVPVFYNAFFRLLSLMLGAAFTPLEKLYGMHVSKSFEDLSVNKSLVEVVLWAENRTAGGQPCHLNSHERKPKFSENCDNLLIIHQTSQQVADAILFARQSITVLEKLEATFTSIFILPICINLLLECILIIVSLIYITSKTIFICVILAIGVIHVWYMLDTPEDYRRKVRKTLSSVRTME